METNTLQRTYNIKKTGFTLYSCFRMFIQSHLLFQLSGITQIFRIPTFQNLYRQKTAGIACQKDNAFVEFHINLSFGSGCVQS